jgi:hypothetical protein
MKFNGLAYLRHDFEIHDPVLRLLMYNYNVSVVVGLNFFDGKRKYFCFQKSLSYLWRCKFFTTLAL